MRKAAKMMQYPENRRITPISDTPIVATIHSIAPCIEYLEYSKMGPLMQ
jgi:hypothetical protein